MVEKNSTQLVARYFFTHPTTEIHLRALTRAVGKSMPVILAAVRKLSLTTVKANAENPLFVQLKRVHNLERLYETGLVDQLRKAFDCQAMVCFGSYSRGDDFEQSDVDIALVGAKQKSIDLSPFESKLKRQISLHFVTKAQVSKEFWHNLANGLVLEGAL
jgi:predicted nucleotidyltransferase